MMREVSHVCILGKADTKSRSSRKPILTFIETTCISLHFTKCNIMKMQLQVCGNTMPDVSDLLKESTGQVDFQHLLVLGQEKFNQL